MSVVAFHVLPVQNRAPNGFYFKDLRWWRGLMPEERENIAFGGCLRLGCKPRVFICGFSDGKRNVAFAERSRVCCGHNKMALLRQWRRWICGGGPRTEEGSLGCVHKGEACRRWGNDGNSPLPPSFCIKKCWVTHTWGKQGKMTFT